MVKFIYKICTKSEWSKFKKNKNFLGTKKDLIDGYIHFSNRNQIKQTLKKYYNKKSDLLLLKVSTSNLKNLVWEKSVTGIVFPHLYSCLKIKNVVMFYKISSQKNGSYLFLSNSSNTYNF